MTKRLKFTDRTVANLKAAQARYEVWDSAASAFGLRIAPSGRKSWIYVYHFAQRPRRITLGNYPQMSLADARSGYAKAKKLLEQGIDPGNEHAQALQELSLAPTVEEFVEQYLEKYARQHKRSANEDERMLRKDVLPIMRGLKLQAVTRKHVNLVLDEVVKRDAPIQANRVLAVMRKMFNYAISRDLMQYNPCTAVQKPGKEKQRDRVLSDQEIRTFWTKLGSCDMTPAVIIALKLMLVTAQRKMEVASARWSDIDEKEKLWTIPADIAKNAKANRVPLSPLALELLINLKALQGSSTGRDKAGASEKGDFLFPARVNEGPITERSIDRAIGRNREKFELPHFTPHDLRRTAASHMTKLGHPRFTVGRILNHADNSVDAVYDRYGYDAEKRAALTDWSAKLRRLVRVKKLTP